MEDISILSLLQIFLNFVSYYRQLSVDIEMKNHKINTNFVSLEGPKARANKSGINFMILILIFVENWT